MIGINRSKINSQVDYYTTESIVSVDWENGFVEASAKENENVNQVNQKMYNSA